MLKVNKITPVIYTIDIQETIEFYVNQLGFNCEGFDIEIGWARVEFDNADLMISLPNSQLQFQKPVFTGSFYFNVGNVDLFWERIKDNVKICYPIENFEYGMREFGIYDNNGYLLQFGEEIINSIS
ncbi:MAG: VOC family protein [Sediminibacterium sp.]